MIYEKGKLYYFKFLDHCLSPDHVLVECEVFGWVLSQDDKRITITYWNVVQDEYKQGNEEPINIIKSTIINSMEVVG